MQSGIQGDMIAEANEAVRYLIPQRIAAEQEAKETYDEYHKSVKERDELSYKIPELQYRLSLLEHSRGQLISTGQGRKNKKLCLS